MSCVQAERGRWGMRKGVSARCVLRIAAYIVQRDAPVSTRSIFMAMEPDRPPAEGRTIDIELLGAAMPKSILGLLPRHCGIAGACCRNEPHRKSEKRKTESSRSTLEGIP